MASKLLRGVGAAALAGTVLFAAACERSPTEPGDHTLAQVEIIDRGTSGQPVVATWTLDGGWVGELPPISLASPNQRISLGARMISAAGEVRDLTTGEYSVRWYEAPGATPGIIDAEGARGERFHGDHVHIYAHPSETRGTSSVAFELWHGDHVDGETDPVEVVVTD